MAQIVGASADAALGLRETKKARTRQLISDIATRLFAERGFERVTVAEIAAAADVSVKTVFNYFPAKEDLFFDRADALLAALTGAITERPAGATALGALHRLMAESLVPVPSPGSAWSSLRDAEQYEHFRAFIATERAAPALRARRLTLAEEWTSVLAATLAAELDRPPADPAIRVLAVMVIAALELRGRELSAAVLERAGARTVERRVRGVVDEAFARLEAAFGDIDRPAHMR